MTEFKFIKFEKVDHYIADRYQMRISSFGGFLDFWLEDQTNEIPPIRIHMHERNMAMLSDALCELVDRHERKTGEKIDRMLEDGPVDAENVVKLR